VSYKFNPFTGTLDDVGPNNGNGVPGGTDTQVQFNDGGVFGGDVDLTWNKTTNVLGITGDINLNDGGTFTTTLQTITPTAARTISLPDATGTVALVAGSSGQFIFNNAGRLGGSSVLSIDGSNNITQNAGRYLLGVTSANANGGVLQLSGGVTFPATQVASADPNTLDDYEEGTWTPTLFMTGVTVVYSTQQGTYRKIGNAVFVQFQVISSSFTFTSASGDLLIGSLPFVAGGGNAQRFGAGVLDFSGITMPNYTQIGVRTENGFDFLALNRSGSGQSNQSVTSSNVTSGTNVRVSGEMFYYI
jgi:hypothetical protein